MNVRSKILSATVTGIALLQVALAAEDKPAATNQKPALSDKEKISYGIGMNIGSNLKRAGFEVDVDVLAGAIRDVMAGGETKLTEQQAREALMAYQKDMATKRQDEQKKTADTNRKAGEAFLEANKKQDGVKSHTVSLADGTTAELQYKVLKEGDGVTPKSTDTVSVNYRGTFINGTEFDSSTKHGDKPAEFPVTGVVKGWTEALQMMKVGEKVELYLPSSLAYGDMGRPGIEPGSTLIFEMELVGIKPPPPPAPTASQPLTSDIIRVPSAEELKKGAKIEVIKPEDVEKQIKAQQQTNQDKKL